MVNEVGCSSGSPNCYQPGFLNGWLLKMFQGCSTAMKGKISKCSSKHWMNSGMAFRGEYLTLNTLEHHKDAAVCMLSEVLEASCPPKYFLNEKELSSLLVRAEARKKSLPNELKRALELQISMLSSTPELAESIQQGRKQKVTDATVNPIPLIQGGTPMLYARRMTPSECEMLQGFPRGWTEVGIEQ